MLAATDKIISPFLFFLQNHCVVHIHTTRVVVAAAALEYDADLIEIPRTGRYV